MNPRDDAPRDEPKKSESTTPDGGIVALYAQRLAAFRRRAPVRKPSPARIIHFGRGAAPSPPAGDQETTAPE